MAKNKNQILIDILANTDNASRGVAGLKDSALSTLGSLGGAITGIQSAFSLAGSAVSSLIGPINEASAANLSLINTTNQFMKLTDLGYDDSRKALIDLNKEMVELGNTLPGVTDDYSQVAISITDNLVPAVKELDGSFTTEGMNKYAKELSKNFGFIAATTDSTSAEMGLVLNRLLTEGTSLSAVARIDALEQNPALIASIESVSKAMGIEFDKATVGQRVQILTEASSVSADALEAAGEDLSVLVSGIQANLFGSQGIFSFQKLFGGDGSAENLGTSVVDELGKTLGALLDPSGPFSAIWSLLGGINFEPMSALRDGIIAFRENVLPQIATIATGLIDVFQSEGVSGIYNTIQNMIGNIDFSQIGFVVGQGLGVAVNFIIDFARNLDWSNFTQIVMGILTGLGVGMLSFATTVDWGGLVIALGSVLIGSIGQTVNTILTALGTALRNLSQALANVITSIIGTGVSAATGAIQMIGNAVGRLASMFSTIASAVVSVVNRISGVANSIRNISIPNVSIPDMAIPNSAGGNFPGGMGSLIQSAMRESTAMPSNAGLVMANSSELILNQSDQRNLLNRLSSNSDGGNYTFNINAIDPMGVSKEVERLLNSRSRFA